MQYREELAGLHEALDLPLLSEEEEKNLIHRWVQSGDTNSLNKLIVSHTKLVVAMAFKMRRSSISLSDLIYEGIAGVTEAAHRFDPSKCVRFSGYAKLWAKLYMRNYIFENWSIVKIGGKVEHRNLFFSWGRLRDSSLLASDHLPKDEAERIALEMNAKAHDVMYLATRFSGGDVSLDAPVTSGTTTTWLNFISDSQALDEDDFLKQVDHSVIQHALRDALTMLTAEECKLIKRRWLDIDETVVDDDQGEVSKESLRNIEKRALRKLRPYLMYYANDIRAFLDGC